MGQVPRSIWLPKPARWMRMSAAIALFAAGVVLLMLWLVGTFRPKIDPAISREVGFRQPGLTGPTAEVSLRTLPLEETAVGTIQPVHRVELASRLLARVLQVDAIAGQRVAAGDILVQLEDTDLRARLLQAQAAVAQAQAGLDQAQIEEARIRAAHERNAVADIELERAVSVVRSAQANLARSSQLEAEARTLLEFATIRAPISGVVIDKRINAGDTVSPGQVVVAILDPARMQLVASVRESLARALSVGDRVMVRVDVLEHACEGIVSEIVPEAHSGSRSFEVKVTGPCPEGVYAGMFGRLAIPVGDEAVLLAPRAALRRIGQLDSVEVAANQTSQRRAVRIGRTFGDEVEILSGLAAGELVIVPPPAESPER